MPYRRCGRSGLLLPEVSLGLWHNFGSVDEFQKCREMILGAFDLGITHFDLANNYGPPPVSAEEIFGGILENDLHAHRDELVISTKAGYRMWPDPHGEWGSRKTLLASLDQSLKRLGIDYVDIFYSHRPDHETPLEETMGALAQAVTSGKALYAGISNYPAEMTRKAADILKAAGVPLLIHQPRYHLLDRSVENGLSSILSEIGAGCIAFSPLAQGLLTGRYLSGIESGSRASKRHGFLKPEHITDQVMRRVRALNNIAEQRGQTLAQLALVWVLARPSVTSVLIGASSLNQIQENMAALEHKQIMPEEFAAIDAACSL
jgi:L-glyceraldehyde 3-phosphate reductase